MGIGISQTESPHYEQIAFEFFQEEILTENLTNKKVTVYKELKPVINLDSTSLSISQHQKNYNPFWFPKCNKLFTEAFQLLYKEQKTNSIKNNISGEKHLNLSRISEANFKIKKYGKGKYPKLFVDQSVTIIVKDIELTIVNISLIEKFKGTIYHIQIDKNGKVKKWCQTGYIE